MSETAEKVSIQIGLTKQNLYLILNRRAADYQQGKIMEVENYNDKRVSHIKYLESILTKNNDIKVEINTTLK